MALLNDYLEKDLHLFDLKTLLEDVDRFSELSSPELHYFCLVDNMALCIMKHSSHYRLWACHWKPSTFFCEDGRPVYPVYYPKGDKWLLCSDRNLFLVKRYFGFYLNQMYLELRDKMFGLTVSEKSSDTQFELEF